MHRGERLTLTIERPAAGGRMIARHDGAIVFVAGAIPGEVVEAEVEKVQRGTGWAITRAVLERSPDRVANLADGTSPSDGGCGGNVFAHIAYDRQRGIKAAIIDDAFRRLGRITLESPAEFALWLAEGQVRDAERQAQKDALAAQRKKNRAKV